MISERIKSIASLIEKNESVVDIGCDHAYLAVQLRKNNHLAKIICAEFREGPLERAKQTLTDYGIENYETILSDGVSNISEQMDVAVMAGMGTYTIEHIMQQDKEYFYNCKKFIVLSNKDVSELRSWLVDNGFKIVDEVMVKEVHFYEILVVTKGQQILSEEEKEFGPIMLKKRSEEFIECYRQQKEKLANLLANLPLNHPDSNKFEEEIAKIERILE